jgi:hypothetical protein
MEIEVDPEFIRDKVTNQPIDKVKYFSHMMINRSPLRM